ncbi:uncharacterized protein LOC144878988 [Branchiostoma floridae x Branchiostoma japonicum]
MSAEKKIPPEMFDPKCNMTPEMTAKLYDNWSGYYEEEIITQRNCRAPRVCAGAVAKALGGSDRGKARVLDVGAGTGACGEEVRRSGFLMWGRGRSVRGRGEKVRVLDVGAGTGACGEEVRGPGS